MKHEALQVMNFVTFASLISPIPDSTANSVGSLHFAAGTLEVRQAQTSKISYAQPKATVVRRSNRSSSTQDDSTQAITLIAHRRSLWTKTSSQGRCMARKKKQNNMNANNKATTPTTNNNTTTNNNNQKRGHIKQPKNSNRPSSV